MSLRLARSDARYISKIVPVAARAKNVQTAKLTTHINQGRLGEGVCGSRVSISAGARRFRGRRVSSPPQCGQTLRASELHVAQNVHSYEQIYASPFAGSAAPHFSHRAFISSCIGNVLNGLRMHCPSATCRANLGPMSAQSNPIKDIEIGPAAYANPGFMRISERIPALRGRVVGDSALPRTRNMAYGRNYGGLLRFICLSPAREKRRPRHQARPSDLRSSMRMPPPG